MRQRNVVWGSTVALALACGGAAAALQQKATTPDAILGEALHQEEAAGNLEAAIDGYKKVIADPSAGRQLVATALLHLGVSYAKLGHKDARATLERVTRDYGDQAQIAAQARAQLAALGGAKVDDDTRVVARQVWAADDVEPFGAPSADGRQYAYIDQTSGNLAIRDLTTGERRQLTHATTAADGYGFSPVMSPDGRHIAYSWWKDGGSIRVIGTDGSRPRVLFQKPGMLVDALRWSPNGRQIAAVDRRHGRRRNLADRAHLCCRRHGHPLEIHRLAGARPRRLLPGRAVPRLRHRSRMPVRASSPSP